MFSLKHCLGAGNGQIYGLYREKCCFIGDIFVTFAKGLYSENLVEKK